MVTKDDVRAFLDRPWDLLRESKDRHNAQRSPSELVEAADGLRQSAAEMGAHSTARDRARDLSSLVRLKRKLERASKNRRRLR